jgi:hypothetical protein
MEQAPRHVPYFPDADVRFRENASTCKTGMPEADLPPHALFLEAEGNQ